VKGTFFTLESTEKTGTGDQRIIVKPDNGDTLILKAGQGFRLKDMTVQWLIWAYDPAATIYANIIVGDGEFQDSNTLNKVTLDASFANNVTVMNTTASPVPVSTQKAAMVAVGEQAAQAVGVTAVSVLNDTTLKRAVFRNSGITGNIAIGSAGITIAKAGIVLGVGETWIEDQAAGLQWYAIADTAGSQLSIGWAK
jgi:hypothetical protein